MIQFSGMARNAVLSTVDRVSVLRRLTIRYCVDQALLPRLLTHTPSEIARSVLLLPKGSEGSQLNQDIFALLCNRFAPGYFVEIGANDGRTLSNTLYLEEAFGWRGGLIEANPRYESSLAQRKARVLMKGVGACDERVKFVDAGLYGGIAGTLDSLHQSETEGAQLVEATITTLQAALRELDAPRLIDFISIDVEGIEVSIVEQLVSSGYRARCGCIEVNDRKADRQRVSEILSRHSYREVWAGHTRQDLFFVDDQV